MLQLQVFTFNPFQENTYVLYNEQQECWFIDPGMFHEEEQQVLLDFVRDQQLSPKAIINTHAHIDHILGIDFLVNRFHIPFYLHEKEMPILNNAANTARMFGFHYEGVKTQPLFLSEGTSLELGADTLEVRFVPGHSPGSVAFYHATAGWVISGDALFSGSVGRTDLLMGDFDTLIYSIKSQLLSLPDATLVYSGHGPSTTIHEEKNSNPFLR